MRGALRQERRVAARAEELAERAERAEQVGYRCQFGSTEHAAFFCPAQGVGQVTRSAERRGRGDPQQPVRFGRAREGRFDLLMDR